MNNWNHENSSGEGRKEVVCAAMEGGRWWRAAVEGGDGGVQRWREEKIACGVWRRRGVCFVLFCFVRAEGYRSKKVHSDTLHG